ncbi:hypothetical protein D3C77_28780 [compost metagenome]
MRLSISYYNEYDQKTRDLCCRCVVLLDGVQVKNCTEADEEEGFVIRFKLDDNGSLILNGAEVETETLTGNVQIIDPLEKKS